MEIRDLVDMLSQSKEAELARLRDALASEKKMNARLWLAVGRLQAAAGEAAGWAYVGELPTSDEEKNGYENFDSNRDAANEVLDGVIGLVK